MDPDERIRGVIRLLFDKFQELGSARQVLLWAQDQALQLPITRRNNRAACRIDWRPAAYHTVLQIEADDFVECPYTRSPPRLHQLGAVRGEPEADLGERAYAAPDRTEVGARRPRSTDRFSCGRCGRTMRVFYGSQSGHAHRYHCRGDDSHVGGWLCIGVGGVRIDRAVAAQIVEAVSEHAVEAAIQAADQSAKADDEIRQALCREFEEARYEAALAARRYEVVDPTKRLVARELETRWNTTLERVAHVEDRIARHDDAAALRPKVDRAALMALARDLPAPGMRRARTPEPSSGSPIS
jgi:hypothetical protein